MLYSIFEYLQDSVALDFPGRHLMTYISFRAGVTFTLALLIALIFGRRIIDRLQRMQVGEVVRNLGLEGQMKKTGTPTMGGIIIIASIMIPCLLMGNLTNIYMLLMLIATLWTGAIGFLDDYRKIKYHNKDGLQGKYKIIGQVGLGLLVGLTMWLSPAIKMSNVPLTTEREAVSELSQASLITSATHDGPTVVMASSSYDTTDMERTVHPVKVYKSPETTIPFVKNNNFNYEWLTSWIPDENAAHTAGWIIFVIVVIVAVTAVSNGANLTDGLDGLCAGTSAIIGTSLAVMAYLGGNVIYSGYLNIMYIPGSEELVVYAAAFIGALVGFLWYNAFPAQVFMGDTGSLMLGGILAVFAILIRKELLIPLLCLIFFIEDLSVVMQVAYFKLTKRKYGQGRRIFKMTPLHHHFQKAGDPAIQCLINFPKQPIPESKIVVRFWIIGILLAALTFVTLKIR
ncbi:MAG: phospho-N-acetylmuramoyl-pentapeptide-transferase [Muribaculaceae bacterium]|nr:phospho-N-acetylmuramoyl-pentapeptide-transferase [Muribaculaceae bacterium]MDE6057855.1 phospho-N-acetylmuramoyl-pentapeptide-transferase [Muribaculaceae bacterium]MDE6855418.1 phospho-N-acetylmuramoyl-pentapeptide-transferase [Muribaculaceae bacterium]